MVFFAEPRMYLLVGTCRIASPYSRDLSTVPGALCRARQELTACENRLKIHADARPRARHAYTST